MYLYPPYNRLIHISVLKLDKKEAMKCAQALAVKLKEAYSPVNEGVTLLFESYLPNSVQVVPPSDVIITAT